MRTVSFRATRTRSAVRPAAVWLVLLVVGCNSGPEYGEVEGTVRFGDKPLANVEVQFLPDPEAGSDGPLASGVTDEQGRYRLRTSRTDRVGAVVGTHRVCINDLAALRGMKVQLPGQASPQSPQPGGGAKGPKIPPLYGDAAATPFRGVQVKPGSQTYDFDVQKGTVLP
jgi:hypothetical protein